MTANTLNLTNISSISLITTKVGEGDNAFDFRTIDESSINLRNVLADILGTTPDQVSDEAMETGAQLGLDSISAFELGYDGSETTVMVSEQFFVSDNLSEYV